MDELNQNSTNNNDFQKEKQNIKMKEEKEISTSDIQDSKNSPQYIDNTNSGDFTEQSTNNVSEEPCETANINCSLDRKKDEKLKNLSFVSIPFVLAAIVISLFNIGKVRQPLSFLLLAIGLIVLGITHFIRSKVISNGCSCKDCTHQRKNCIKYGIFYSIASLAFIAPFIYYMVI